MEHILNVPDVDFRVDLTRHENNIKLLTYFFAPTAHFNRVVRGVGQAHWAVVINAPRTSRDIAAMYHPCVISTEKVLRKSGLLSFEI